MVVRDCLLKLFNLSLNALVLFLIGFECSEEPTFVVIHLYISSVLDLTKGKPSSKIETRYSRCLELHVPTLKPTNFLIHTSVNNLNCR